MKGGKGLSLLIGIGKPKDKGESGADREPDDEEAPPDLELEGQAVLKALKSGDTKAFTQALREFIDAHHDAPMGDDDADDDEQDK